MEEEEPPVKASTKASRSRRSQKSKIKELYLIEYYRAIAKEKEERGEAFVWKLRREKNGEYTLTQVVIPEPTESTGEEQ